MHRNLFGGGGGDGEIAACLKSERNALMLEKGIIQLHNKKLIRLPCALTS